MGEKRSHDRNQIHTFTGGPLLTERRSCLVVELVYVFHAVLRKIGRATYSEVGLYRSPAPAGIRRFFQIRQKSGSG